MSSPATPATVTFGQRVRSVLGRARAEASWQQWVLLGVALVSALGMRYALLPDVSRDVAHFIEPWLGHIRAGGFWSLGESFANYNPPYLYLLYLGTLTPLSDIAIVKVIAAIFDLILALGVAAIAYRLRARMLIAAIAGIGILFLPEVFVNSAQWGQVDGVFTAFLVWSAWALLSKRHTLAWVLFLLAFAFKLQAIFLLPWIALAFIVQRHRWRSLAIGVGAFLLSYLPAIIAGRSLASLAAIYPGQAGSRQVLTINAVNIYQWIPKSFAPTVLPAAVFLTAGIVALLLVLYLRRPPAPDLAGPWLLRIAAVMGLIIPFLLPVMHDRYFFTGGVFAAICVLVDRRYMIPALILQFTAMMAYSPFLWREAIMPGWAIAIPQLIAVLWVVWLSLPPGFASGATSALSPRPRVESENKQDLWRESTHG